MARWLRVVLVIVVLAVLAGRHFLHSRTLPPPALSAAIHDASLQLGGHVRHYLSYVPAGLSPGAPLVIVLHGSSMTSVMMRAGTGYEFDQLADQHHFAVVYPDGYKRNWNDCRSKANFPAKLQNIDDTGFMRALVANMRQQAGIDPRRVYVLGYSNGGHMALRLGLEAPQEFPAVVAVAASLPVADESSCPPQGPTARTLLIDGTADPISPYNGGEVSIFGFGKRGHVLGAEASVRELARRNSLNQAPQRVELPHLHPDDPTHVQRLSWLGQGGQVLVELDSVEGGGHVVPQSAFRYPRILGRTTGDIDAPQAAVAFFGL